MILNKVYTLRTSTMKMNLQFVITKLRASIVVLIKHYARSGAAHRPIRLDMQFQKNGGTTMFNKKSDYALNKREKEAIVYVSVTGTIYLSHKDFNNEEEFLKWKSYRNPEPSPPYIA